MKVYCVMKSYPYEDSWIINVYSTYEKAKTFIEEEIKNKSDPFEQQGKYVWGNK